MSHAIICIDKRLGSTLLSRKDVLAWHMGNDYSYCIALAIVFPWIVENT